MIERLRYSANTKGLLEITMPKRVYGRAMSIDKHFTDRLSRSGSPWQIRRVQDEGKTQHRVASLDLAVIGKTKNAYARQQLARQTAQDLALFSFTAPNFKETSEQLIITEFNNRASNSFFGFRVECVPETRQYESGDGQCVAQTILGAQRALKQPALIKQNRATAPQVVLSPVEGIRLQLSSGSMIATSEHRFKSNDQVVELIGQNVENTYEPLIYFMGAVALTQNPPASR